MASLQSALTAQGAAVGRPEQSIQEATALLHTLASQVALLNTHFAQVSLQLSATFAPPPADSRFRDSLSSSVSSVSPPRRLRLLFPQFKPNIQRCCQVWKAVHTALIRSLARNREIANHRRSPAPYYQPGQNVWLSLKDLPLQVDSQKPVRVSLDHIKEIIN